MPDVQSLLDEGLKAERAGALDRALQAYQSAGMAAVTPEHQAEAYTRIADVFREQCQWTDAIEAAHKAQAVAEKAQLSRQLAEAQIAEANVYLTRGDFADAMPRFERLADAASDPRLRGIALQNIGSMLAQMGRHGAAERAFQESLGQFHKADYARGEAIALNNLGRLALDQGDPARAAPLLELAHDQACRIEDAELAAIAEQNLAAALVESGHADRALDMAMAALGYFTACGNGWRQIECLRLVGSIHEQAGDSQSAVRCYERALSLAEEVESDVEVQVTRRQLERLKGGHR
jgi:tetratricopeptide (TPR) repeat protein